MAGERPAGCRCHNPDQTLPCWPCYREGFEDPNPGVDERELRPLRPTEEYFERRAG